MNGDKYPQFRGFQPRSRPENFYSYRGRGRGRGGRPGSAYPRPYGYQEQYTRSGNNHGGYHQGTGYNGLPYENPQGRSASYHGFGPQQGYEERAWNRDANSRYGSYNSGEQGMGMGSARGDVNNTTDSSAAASVSATRVDGAGAGNAYSARPTNDYHSYSNGNANGNQNAYYSYEHNYQSQNQNQSQNQPHQHQHQPYQQRQYQYPKYQQLHQQPQQTSQIPHIQTSVQQTPSPLTHSEKTPQPTADQQRLFAEKHWLDRIHVEGSARKELSALFDQLDKSNSELGQIEVKKLSIELEVMKLDRFAHTEQQRAGLSEDILEEMKMEM
ncbi:hypothetical protein DAMA08_019130 [Martiniozyma asiatica (nom. inval.)]|nr:hypothetical protein DAMA08_019130 [Martiniozyma asiatica]